jgi:hypothetical protein
MPRRCISIDRWMDWLVGSLMMCSAPIRWSLRATRTYSLGPFVDELEYIWKVYVEGKVMLLLFLLCALVSLAVRCRIHSSDLSFFFRCRR